MRALSHRRPIAAASLVALLVALSGCGGGGDDSAGDHGSFDPITCSALPSPCA